MKCYPHLSHWLGACDIPLQCLPLCPQVINQPTHSQLEKGHDARQPRSVSCQSTHSYCFPTRPSQVENINPEAFLQYIFLPKLNFWSTCARCDTVRRTMKGRWTKGSQLCELITLPSSIPIHPAKRQGDTTPGTLWNSSSRHSGPELVSKSRFI